MKKETEKQGKFQENFIVFIHVIMIRRQGLRMMEMHALRVFWPLISIIQ